MLDGIAWNEDCIRNMVTRLGPESVDLCVTSVPFSDLFSYSGKVEDVGNCKDGTDSRISEFGLSFRFFVSQLLEVMKPGCNVCCHIMQLIAFKNKHGYMGKRDFRGAVIDMFVTGGFEYQGEMTIQKNPQRVAQAQNLHSLMFATGYRNARLLAPTCNDMVLILHKPGEAKPVPAIYDKVKNPGGWVTTDEWIRDAHGIWTDILEIDTLEGWKSGREEDDERHICALQLEVIRRCVKLYSNPGELVFDPFGGIGSVPYVAIEQGRSAATFELKESYFAICQRNIAKALAAGRQDGRPNLFTWAEAANGDGNGDGDAPDLDQMDVADGYWSGM